ncbi:MAG: hypothetical protein GXO71_00780 [Caldiserica bacterium]|nr:hypothetical protein [Caldisericota bacterium]
MIIGALFSLLAVLMAHYSVQERFIGWPLHPIKFAIGSVNWIAYLLLSIFLAWLLKFLILRYGGPRIYIRIRHFFLGLILGQYSAPGL